jgi:hypothetical protein
MKTAKEIQGDVIGLLKNSGLAGTVNGRVFREGYRPRNSRAEDIVVIFTTGLPGQLHVGVVTVNVFIPDIEDQDSGVAVENGRRCGELEVACSDWVESLTTAVSDYRFTLQQTIYTENDAEIKQHFVVIKLKYEIIELD